MEKRRVVITGLGAVTPLGHTARETWEAAKAGVCGIAPITLYDHSAQKVSLAGEVKEFDPSGVLEKKEIRRMDRFAQFAVTAAAEAMAEVFAEMEAQATRSFSPEETETLRTLLNRMCADAQAAEQGAQGV